MRHAVWWLAPLLGCSFQIDPLLPIGDGASGPQPDLRGADLAGLDLSSTVKADMAGMPPQPDMAVVVPSFTPSHVPAHFVTDGTCMLTPAMSIDTSALQIDGAAPPAGCVFATAMEAGNLEVAVLAVRDFSLSKAITVTGTRPLVIVAGDTIDISQAMDAGAHGSKPGPGGAASRMGDGAGGDGAHGGGFIDSGGGGAGYGENGATGGTASDGGNNSVTGGKGGAVYPGDDALTMSVPGGSGGGAWATEMDGSCGGADHGGGGGGGSVQLSAAVQVKVSGKITVGGGGGAGGCTDIGGASSGAGGGSGGAIFLEAPSVMVPGTLAANGGGGGGASTYAGGNGGAGDDGAAGNGPANGGKGTNQGGAGGKGGAKGMPPTAGANMTGAAGDAGGGGGGGVGRIVVRSHGAAMLSNNVSPAAVLDPNL